MEERKRRDFYRCEGSILVCSRSARTALVLLPSCNLPLGELTRMGTSPTTKCIYFRWFVISAHMKETRVEVGIRICTRPQLGINLGIKAVIFSSRSREGILFFIMHPSCFASVSPLNFWQGFKLGNLF